MLMESSLLSMHHGAGFLGVDRLSFKLILNHNMAVMLLGVSAPDAL